MKVALIGPTNIQKLSTIIGKSVADVESLARDVGKVLAQSKCQLVVGFNYSGVIKLVGDGYKKHGGKLEILYTENNADWDTVIYMKHLQEADVKTKKGSWHDLLLSLVTDVDVVLCAGLSAGALGELAYMKWNFQESKGKVKALIGVKELLRNGEFPPEIQYDLDKIIIISSIKELDKILKSHKS